MSDQMPPMPSQWAGPPPYQQGRPARTPLAATTPVYTAWIWIVVLAPLAQYPLQLAYHPEIRYRMIGRYPVADTSGIFTRIYFLILGIGILLYAVVVVCSLLDRRELMRRGVERPFHWAWAFLGGIVYAIGRSVIVHRVARPRGLVPVWVLIGVYVVGVVITTIWTVGYMNDVLRHLPYPTS